LFDLLGITSPPVVDGVDNEPLDKAGKGILPITRADIERSGAGDGKKQEKKGRVPRTRPDAVETEPEPKQPGGRRDKSTELTNGKQDRDANSESESKRKRPQRKTKAKPDDPSVLSASTSSPIVTTPLSTLSATRPKGEGRRQGRGKAIVEPVRQDSSDEAFETASLSQSLPSERLFGPSRSGPLDQAGAGSTNGKGRGKGKKGNALADEDDSLVWEMPQVPGPSANQALTVSLAEQRPAQRAYTHSGSRSSSHPPALPTHPVDPPNPLLSPIQARTLTRRRVAPACQTAETARVPTPRSSPHIRRPPCLRPRSSRVRRPPADYRSTTTFPFQRSTTRSHFTPASTYIARRRHPPSSLATWHPRINCRSCTKNSRGSPRDLSLPHTSPHRPLRPASSPCRPYRRPRTPRSNTRARLSITLHTAQVCPNPTWTIFDPAGRVSVSTRTAPTLQNDMASDLRTGCNNSVY